MARASWMVPLDLQNAYTRWLVHEFLSNLKRGIGWLTLRRALIEREPGFWGDSPTSPSSVVYMREGGCQVEAFGLFSPRPAVRWLAALERPVALLAPAGWAKAVRVRAGPADRAEVVSWVPVFYKPNLSRSVIPTRGLNLADAEAFAASSPEWALRCWPTFEALVNRGAAVGAPFGEGFAAIAWVVDRTESFDAIGVYTLPRYRSLGLGRAVASDLVDQIVHERQKIPLWAASAGNAASGALARSLGFTPRVSEWVFRWPPRNPAAREVVETASTGSLWMSDNES